MMQSQDTCPPTCYLERIDNDPTYQQAYQQMAIAINTKLDKTNMAKVPLFETFINHERDSFDGFRVLYAMLSVTHPKLTTKV